NSASIFACASSGAIQRLFGPASSRPRVRSRVRCSTRATSCGSERCSQLCGWVCSLSRTRVPSASISAISLAFSASLPSHQWMASGRVSAATSATQSLSAANVLPSVPGMFMSLVRAFKGTVSLQCSWNEGGHHVLDVGLELFVLQPRLLHLQVELQEADVGRIGQACPVLGVGAVEAGLPERSGEVLKATRGHALDHRAHDRVVQGLEQLAVDDVGARLVRDQVEQRAQALGGIRYGLELAEHFFLLHLLP